MGCGSSKDVIMLRIKAQEKKIDDLIEINKNLELRLKELHQHALSHNKNPSDTGSDLTNLKTTIDVRFMKLEKTVEKIHNDFKVKMFDGFAEAGEHNSKVAGNGKGNVANEPIQMNDNSLSLNLDKDAGKEKAMEWNDLLHDSNPTPLKLAGEGNMDDAGIFDETPGNDIGRMMKKFENNENVLNTNDVKINFNATGGSQKVLTDTQTTTKEKSSNKGGPYKLEEILEDEKIKNVLSDVMNKGFKVNSRPTTSKA